MNNCCMAGREIPLSELNQQLDYARITSADICEIFSCQTPSISELLNNYEVVRTKISMLQDFLFQAKLWCDMLVPEEECTRKTKIRRKNEDIKN